MEFWGKQGQFNSGMSCLHCTSAVELCPSRSRWGTGPARNGAQAEQRTEYLGTYMHPREGSPQGRVDTTVDHLEYLQPRCGCRCIAWPSQVGCDVCPLSQTRLISF